MDSYIHIKECRLRIRNMTDEELIEIVKEIPLSIMLNECKVRTELLEAKNNALKNILCSKEV